MFYSIAQRRFIRARKKPDVTTGGYKQQQQQSAPEMSFVLTC